MNLPEESLTIETVVPGPVKHRLEAYLKESGKTWEQIGAEALMVYYGHVMLGKDIDESVPTIRDSAVLQTRQTSQHRKPG